MTGFASRTEPAQGIHDPITARAVLLDNGETSLAIVACDLLGFSPESVASMRQGIADRTSIAPGHVLISCTHTHSGPTSLPMRGALGYMDNAWLTAAEGKIVDLVAGLPSELRPARFAHSSTTVTGISFNRQDRTHDHDEELVVIGVESESGDAVATVVNYAMHAVVLGGSYMLYSADFPGQANRRVEQARGGVSLYLQGACGDINPDLDARGDFRDCERLGDILARAAVSALTGAARESEVVLSAASRIVDVPLDPPPTLAELDQQIARFRADKQAAQTSGSMINELIAQAMSDWASELRSLIETDSVPMTLPVEVFAAGINDLRIVTLPFETYNDIGRGIKQGIKPLRGLFAGYSNGLFGYCPTRWAKEQGGYGPRGSMPWFGALVTPVGYGADEILIREGIALAGSL